MFDGHQETTHNGRHLADLLDHTEEKTVKARQRGNLTKGGEAYFPQCN